MNLEFASAMLRMLVTMFWKAGTRSLARLDSPDPPGLQIPQPIQSALNSQPGRM
jgi:hypothetical protein